MDLLLGATPKPATSPVEPADGHAPLVLLEETGELLPAETTAPDLPAEPVADVAGETPVGGPVEATETAGLPATDTVIETVEPELPTAPTKPRRSRKRAPAVAAEGSSTPAEAVPAGEVVAVETSPAPVETVPAGEVVVEVSRPPAKPAGRPRGDPHDAVLEPAYVPMKLTVMVPTVVLAELARTVQTIRRMTGQRQSVNQGTVVAAALEMAFEEFKKKGAASQLVDKLRLE